MKKAAAFIFDDGPHPEQRVKMLDVLEKINLHVTFACIGYKAEARPDLIEVAAKAGHEQINHTWSHSNCNQLSPAETENEIRRTRDLLEKYTGRPSPWFWPPYGLCNDSCAAVLASLGMKAVNRIGISMKGSFDWERDRDGDSIYQICTTDVPDQAFFIFHEWREATLEVLPAIVKELRAQGFELLTVSELASMFQ